MPAVATKADTILCGHPGGTVATVGAPKLTVNGSPVLLAAGVMGKAVLTCGIIDNTGTPPSTHCKFVTAVTNPPSLSTKLTVSGAPVVMATLKGQTDGVVAGVTPQLLLAATVVQTKLITV